MNIALVISSLEAGGAERVMSIMANYWADKGWNITLLTFDDGRTQPFYNISSNINHIPLGLLWKSTGLVSSLISNYKRNWIIRKAIRDSNPDVVISFIDTANIRTLLASIGLSIPVIISERTDPSHHHIGKAWSFLRQITYPLAARIIFQSQKALEQFPPQIRDKGTVIHNPIHTHATRTPLPPKNDGLIVSVARLSPEKGGELLIKSFELFLRRQNQWTLKMVGDGPERVRLKKLAEDFGILDKIMFTGRVDDVTSELAQADIFVLPSQYEGFPNALCEAMIMGIAPIATDTLGAREIIKHEQNGLIVNHSPSSLAAALERLADSPTLRDRLGAQAQRLEKTLAVKNIMNQWESTIYSVIR